MLNQKAKCKTDFKLTNMYIFYVFINLFKNILLKKKSMAVMSGWWESWVRDREVNVWDFTQEREVRFWWEEGKGEGPKEKNDFVQLILLHWREAWRSRSEESQLEGWAGRWRGV